VFLIQAGDGGTSNSGGCDRNALPQAAPASLAFALAGPAAMFFDDASDSSTGKANLCHLLIAMLWV